MFGHRMPALRTSSNRQRCTRRLAASATSLHRHLGDDGEHAFRADHQREQIEPGGVEAVAADLDRSPSIVRPRSFSMLCTRQAVLEAMHAAGVFGDVAADRARDLATRVRRVVEAVWRRRLGNRQIAHARLHRGGSCQRSIFRMRFNFASDSNTPAACGSALPDRPVPAPRATTGVCNAWQSRSTSAT